MKGYISLGIGLLGLLIGGEFLSYPSLIGQLKKDILLDILLDIPWDIYPCSVFGSEDVHTDKMYI